MTRFSTLGARCAFVILFFLATLCVPAFVQAQEQEGIAEKVRSSIAPIDKRIREIEQSLEQSQLSEDELTALRAELDAISGDVLEKVTSFLPELSALNSRIERLPPPPAQGEPEEPAEIAQERSDLARRKATATVAIKDAEILSVRAAQLVSRVLEERRNQFVSSLLRRRDLDAGVFREFATESGTAFTRIADTVGNWISSTFRNKLASLLAAIVLTALLVAMLAWILRPLRFWVRRVEASDEVSPLQKIMLAFLATVVPGLAIAVFAVALHAFLGYFGLYRLRIDHMVAHLLVVLTGLAFVWLLLRAILAPGHSNRRLVEMTDGAARRLFLLGILMALIYGLDYYGTQLISLFSLPVSFTIVKTLFGSLLIAVVLVAIVMTRLTPADPEAPRSGFRGWNPVFYWLIWLSIGAIVLAAVSGYISLSRFIAGQIIITGSILATMYIGFLTSRALAAQGGLASTSLGMKLRQKRDLSDFRLDQLGLVLSILTNIAILTIGLPILLLQWGIQADEIWGWVRSAFTGFTVGGVQISIARIAFAIVAFFLLIVATRFIQRWFEGKVLARTQLDSGVKNSIRSGVGYIGFFLAALVGISWAGFNLSNIALIAGALSVGIGFGLQNIVNNFVSGIIMLIERPIKVGDIIAVAGSEGFVRKINVRATELETFDRQSVIIPNSEVINTSVGNWMHTDHMRRIVIAVGVAYGSDTEKVRELLLECVQNDERVATHPAPFVHFSDFGASSLDFQLRFFIRDLMLYPIVETDIRFAIDRAFRENGIEIPFPQTDLHIRSGLPAGNKPAR